MTKFKKVMTTGAMVLSIGALGMTAFAATNYTTNAEVVANLTGRTTQSVMDEKVETGKTYGTIANESGKLDEFKVLSLEVKKANLAQQVAAGTMTQEEADAILMTIETNQLTCDGTGTNQIGKEMGAGFGTGKGRGQGKGGMRLQDGSCNK